MATKSLTMTMMISCVRHCQWEKEIQLSRQVSYRFYLDILWELLMACCLNTCYSISRTNLFWLMNHKVTLNLVYWKLTIVNNLIKRHSKLFHSMRCRKMSLLFEPCKIKANGTGCCYTETEMERCFKWQGRKHFQCTSLWMPNLFCC